MGARIDGGVLTLTNDATGAANANGWVFASTATAAFMSPFATTLSSNPGLVTWELNMRQIRADPSGFASANNYGVAFILGGTTTTAATAGQGYALVLGQNGSTDPIRLATYSAGLQSAGGLTNIITASAALTDVGAEYLSLRVTFDPATSTWTLLGRSDGASAFADPSSGTLTTLGTVIDTTFVNTALTVMGGYWQGSTIASQTAQFDNVKVAVTVAAAPILYWDGNGDIAGAGPTPVGTWGTDLFWSASADGSVTTTAWMAGVDAVFSAGTDAVNPFAVSVSGTQSARSLSFEEGNVTLSGGIIEITGSVPKITVATGAAGTIGSTLAATVGLTKSGAGVLRLEGANVGLFGMSLGDAYATPATGGEIVITNKDALGTADTDGTAGAPVVYSQFQMNYGTLTATTALTGLNAIPNGVSLAGRLAAPVAFAGESIQFVGDSSLFAASGSSGDIVVNVNNHTTIAGAVTPTGTGSISGLSIGGTGRLTFAGTLTALTTALKLRDSVTVEINTAEVSSLGVPAAPVHTLSAGTALAIGTIGSTTSVIAYGGIHAAADSVLRFDIGGTTRGAAVSGYDALILAKPTTASAGAITFAGWIEVSLINGFLPVAGQSFDLLDWDASLTPDFTSLTFQLPDISGTGLAWVTTSFTTDGTISVITDNPITSVTIARVPTTNPLFVGDSVTFNVTAVTGGIAPYVYQWRKGGTIIPSATNSSYTIASPTVADTGDYDCIVSKTGGSRGSNVLPLVVVPLTPEITLEPVSRMLHTGQPLTLTVTATGKPSLKYQWKKEGINIAGATSASYNITAVALTHAGSYTCEVSSTASTVKDTSAVVQVGVVENSTVTEVLAPGATTTLKLSAAGNGHAFLWRKDGGNLPADGSFSISPDGKTLTIRPTAVSHSGTYTCQVIGPGGVLIGGTTTLKVFDTKPEITQPVVMPRGIISGTYLYDIPISALPNKAPTAFTATNLPTGLTCNPKTGRISGKPTKSGIITGIKLSASNSKGKDEVTVTLTIDAFPANLAGVYAGQVPRQAVLGSNLGGRFDITLSSIGGITGSLTLGTLKYPLVGALEVDVNAVLLPSATLTIKRTGTPLPAPLTVTFSMDASKNRLSTGNVTDGTHNVAFTAWRQIWSTTPVAANASTYLGYHTFGIALPDGDSLSGSTNVPQGSGYGSFTVAKDGKLSITGKTPDGEPLTASTFVGPLGEVLIFQTLYTTVLKGSLLGHLVINPADNMIGGTLSWSRPANTAATARTYAAGFGPLNLAAQGGLYTPPVSPALVLGLAGPGTATLTFTEGDIDSATLNSDGVPFFDYTVGIGTKNVVTYPALPANTRKVKLSPLTTTGVFGGTFELSEVIPPATLPVKRAVTYQGCIVKTAIGYDGVGYFMLPLLPTPTKGAIRSGHVLLRAD